MAVKLIFLVIAVLVVINYALAASIGKPSESKPASKDLKVHKPSALPTSLAAAEKKMNLPLEKAVESDSAPHNRQKRHKHKHGHVVVVVNPGYHRGYHHRG